MPQVNALKVAMSEISQGLDRDHSVLSIKPTYLDDLQASVKACCLVIDEIDKHLQVVWQCPDLDTRSHP